MASNKGLGKGLGALLGDFSEEPTSDSAYRLLPIYKVEPNPDQPRHDFDEEELQALSESISVHGVIQPLTVREMPNGYYQIIAGERRWRAARMANISDVPVIVVEADDKKAMELALIENLQRQDLNPVEEALGYQSLIEEYGLTQEVAAKRLGKSRSAVANTMRLLTLPDSVQKQVSKGEISTGHAKVLLGLPSAQLMTDAANEVAQRGLNVRQTEALCKKLAKPPKPPKPVDAFTRPKRAVEVEAALKEVLGSEVHVDYKNGRGSLKIDFYSDEMLQAFVELLGRYENQNQ